MLMFIELFLLGIGLAMDAFAVSVCKGLGMRRLNKKQTLIIGLYFGGFQALMPLIGYYLGSLFADMVTRYSHWVAFALLLAIGGNMIKESLGEEENVSNDMGFKSMLLLAIATSIDALAAGISISLTKTAILVPACLIACTTFLFALVGYWSGCCLKRFSTKYLEIFAGLILIILALKSLF